MSLALPDVDDERFEQQWVLDLDVLRSLAENGDRAEIPRAIDISFIGDSIALDRLAEVSTEFGFAIQDRTITEDGQDWLFLERVQTVDAEAIRAMRRLAVQIEEYFGVECDGWGCVAQTGLIH